MNRETKSLLKILIKDVILILAIINLILLVIGHAMLAFIFSLGLLVATINFILSGVMLEKTINSKKKIIKYVFPLSYILRIITIIIIAYPFIYNIEKLLAYVLGFISFFVVLTITWLKMQRGVSKWSHTNL
ncbi:hypothetical protein H8S10_09340 [Clostridium sp. NSJ-49]|jgi:ATP synthase protein I|uniref:ATP synthase I chain n=1 Tax=Clostridium disporicum TaxID=84024 RepID=A0A174FR33_9CLOT|nr:MULTISPECIES: ATP synthase subunit I [Clostridium]MBC5625654.1 hypothetical protein [Clostridium sp. NSJ-49]MCD2501493.1 hypothetical protein [Clostridium sp. NSJ-145]CUO52181.1 Uncharacterised protein [Clostridium disporicum]